MFFLQTFKLLSFAGRLSKPPKHLLDKGGSDDSESEEDVVKKRLMEEDESKSLVCFEVEQRKICLSFCFVACVHNIT